MNRIKNSLIAFGGLSLLIGAIAFATPRPTQGQGGDAQLGDYNTTRVALRRPVEERL